MLRDYTTLPTMFMQAGAGFAQPSQALPEQVRVDDPAVLVMTDLKSVSAVLIRPTDTIDEALSRMKQRGVRLLLVADADRKVVGLITATDLLGEKPMQFARQGGVRHEDILVSDIMTPQARLEVLNLDDVLNAKVGHVVATLRKAGRQHAVVVEVDNNGRHTVRGLFSASQIARQLGVAIQTTEVARTFAEIEAMLAR
ncbi:MAG TPA: CBS domain-containing protein [Burkholderiales bacterium]|nr:CBS domain-containing protein [Burkholderiales bacterium]